MECDKKLKGNRCCDVCIFGFIMENIGKSMVFGISHPYVPVIVSNTMNGERKISCDQGSNSNKQND